MKLTGHQHDQRLTALAAAVDVTVAALTLNADGTATQRVKLLPMGPFTTRGKGRFVVADLDHARAIVALSVAWAGAQDIPFDYDHQLVYGAKDGVGGQAPASGWLDPKSLSAEADGIYGTVTWTAKAATAINNKEYKYLSPVIDHAADGKVNALIMGALTAYPAIDGLTRLAASATTHLSQEPDMDLTALAASLNLPATATLAEITAAQMAQATALSAAQADLTALRTTLGANDQATALSAATTLAAGAGDTAALMASMQSQLASLTASANEGEVDAAIASGRVTPAQRAHYVALMGTNPALARTLMGSNPVVVPTGEALSGKPTPGAKITALSAEQRKVADMLGVSEADYLATLQESAV